LIAAVELFLALGSGQVVAAVVYSNSLYNYSAKIPDGFAVQYDEPPAPDHGFTILLGGARRLTVFADYDDLSDGSATSALRRALSYEHLAANPPLRRTRLAGIPASGAEFEVSERRIIRWVAFRANGGSAAILYHFYLDTDASHARRDCATFRRVLGNFTLTPLQ
jgi:hypothetical protein